jgi:transketolase
MNKLEKRVVELSYKYGLTHIGSCLTSVNIIDKIYQVKKKTDPFILSNGHAALALYVVLEKWEGKDAEKLVKKHGTHPNRDLDDGIYCSTGSLGMGITVAVGMALADREHRVYVLMSDGECAEGAVWEALQVAANQRLENLNIAVVCNGYSAYGRVDVDDLDTRLNAFYPCLCFRSNLFNLPEFMQGLAGHYLKLNKEQYDELMLIKN